MNKFVKVAVIVIGFSIFTGCTTTGTFVVPENSQLYINNKAEPVTVEANGQVVTRPFFWSSIGGAPYRLEKNGQTLKEGKLKTSFRIVSIFWPPYALVYWPAGLNPNLTYDLVNDTQE